MKVLSIMKMEWARVQSAMSELRFLEVSHCASLQSFPCDFKTLGYWKKGKEEIKKEEKEEEEEEDIKKEETKEEEIKKRRGRQVMRRYMSLGRMPPRTA